MKTFKKIIAAIAFILIFVLVFSGLSELFSRKTLEGTWNHTQKISGFYNEPQNEFDIMYFGSSNTYCSFNPLIFFEESGIKSYVSASQQQPVWATYTYMKEALKTQTPRLMVMDVLMFSKDTEYYDDGVNYSFMDDIPFSMNKVELAFASAPPDDAIRLLINFIKYHSRWSELTEDDYTFERDKANDYLKGYVLLEDTFADAPPPTCNITESTPLSEKEIKYFDKIVNLSKEHNIPLLLVKTPSNVTESDAKLFNSIEQLAAEKNVPFVDFNDFYPEIGLELTTDFYDKSHLNYKGAEKFTRYFAEYINSKYALPPSDDKNNTSSVWQENLEKYYNYCSEL